jgi:membrane protease YdiL (CAAX protease family)
MNAKRNLLHWANLLYVVIVIASLPFTQGAGGGAPPAWLDPGLGLVAAQVGLILIPTLLFIWLTRQPLTEMLKLRRLDGWTGVKCLLVGLTSWPMFLFLSTCGQALVGLVSPARPADTVNILRQPGSPWIAFLGLALVAPICEEALCRGVLLSIYEERFAARAIWMAGILFALLHPSIDQALGALFVGTVAGWVVYRTRSIWSGVLVHAGTNLISALLVLLVTLAMPAGVESATQAQAGDMASAVWIGLLVWGGIAAVMLIPWFFLLRSVGKHYAPPTWPEPEARPSLNSLWSWVAPVVGTAGYAIYKLF